MRIISGTLRGKILKSPLGQNTRPTSDKARQGIFNIIEHSPICDGIVGKTFLDVFAGTGAFGLEAMSRGAKSACFIEKDKNAIAILRENIKACRVENFTQIITQDATKIDKKIGQFDIVFLDPPYEKGLVTLALNSLFEIGAIGENTLIIAEHKKGEDIEIPAPLEILREVNYGINAFKLAKLQD